MPTSSPTSNPVLRAAARIFCLLSLCTGQELLRRLAVQLAVLGLACDRAYLRAARAGAHAELSALGSDLLLVQREVLSSGRWQAAAGYAHAVGAAALVQVRRAQSATSTEARAQALEVAMWLWDGETGAGDLGAGEVFLGLRQLISFGSDMKAATSSLATAMTAVAQLGTRLLMGEVTIQLFIEELSTNVSKACTDVLADAEDQLRRVLTEPCQRAARLALLHDGQEMLQKIPDIVHASQDLLQEAATVLAAATLGMTKLAALLEKVRVVAGVIASHENVAENAIVFAVARLEQKVMQIKPTQVESEGAGGLWSAKHMRNVSQMLRALVQIQKSCKSAALGCLVSNKESSPNKIETALQDAAHHIGTDLRAAARQIHDKMVFGSKEAGEPQSAEVAKAVGATAADGLAPEPSLEDVAQELEGSGKADRGRRGLTAGEGYSLRSLHASRSGCEASAEEHSDADSKGAVTDGRG